MATRTQHPRRVELYVRSLSFDGARNNQKQAIETLRCLAVDNDIDALTVTVWGTEISLSSTARETDTGAVVLDRLAEFKEWASDRDVSVAQFFETREVWSRVTGEEYTAVVLPTICMAEYHDDDLQYVTPNVDGENTTTVIDRITELEAEHETERARASKDESRVCLTQ
jgi:hypothetical protein